GWFFEKPLLCQIGAPLVKLPECSIQGDKSAVNGADHGCSAPHAYDNWPYLALERDTGVAQALVQEAVDFAETLTESDFGCSSELDYRAIETMKPAGFGTPSSTSSRSEATPLRCCLVAG